MWKVLEHKWVRRTLDVASIGSIGFWIWPALSSAFGWIVGGAAVIGALLAIRDGYGYVGIGGIALAFAMATSVTIFILSLAREKWIQSNIATKPHVNESSSQLSIQRSEPSKGR